MDNDVSVKDDPVVNATDGDYVRYYLFRHEKDALAAMSKVVGTVNRVAFCGHAASTKLCFELCWEPREGGRMAVRMRYHDGAGTLSVPDWKADPPKVLTFEVYDKSDWNIAEVAAIRASDEPIAPFGENYREPRCLVTPMH